ncbi:MAG: periplasmic heavy metal sensor [Hyphomicrobium sp.]
MTNETVEAAAPRRPRWLYGVLIASLGINLLVAGGAASAFWRHRHGGHERGLMSFVRELPAERRPPIEEYIRSEREKLKPMREAIRAGWTETNTVLGEEPFDKEKLKASMGRVIDAETRMRTAISEALVETAAKLTPPERQAMKAWRERTRDGRHKKWRRLRDKDEGEGG